MKRILVLISCLLFSLSFAGPSKKVPVSLLLDKALVKRGIHAKVKITARKRAQGVQLVIIRDPSSNNYMAVDSSGRITITGTITATPSGTQTVKGAGTAGTADTGVVTVQGIASMTPILATATQSGTWNITNISGTVSLPTGAATAAKQPALGTAGSASADVITIQGIASMTAVTVTGTVSVNALPAGTALIGQVAASAEGGNFYNGTTALTVTRKGGTVSSSGATTVVSLVSSKSIYVLGVWIISNGTVNVNLQSHTTTSNTSATMYLVANTGLSSGYCPLGWFATTNGEALDINLSGNVSVGYTIVYVAY